MSRVVAVANQKGGVAKTTTVATIGSLLGELGIRTLLIDLDSQACLSFSYGVSASDDFGSSAVLQGRLPIPSAMHWLSPTVALIPGGPELASLDGRLGSVPDNGYLLKRAMAPIGHEFDVVLIDCMPSMGLLTHNAFIAADEVIVPMQCEMLAHRGVGQLLDTIADVVCGPNPGLMVRGILPTMFDSRTAHAHAVVTDVAQRYAVPVLGPAIPRSIRFAEAPAAGHPVTVTAPQSAGAQAYDLVARRLCYLWNLGPNPDLVLDVREEQARVAATRGNGRHLDDRVRGPLSS